MTVLGLLKGMRHKGVTARETIVLVVLHKESLTPTQIGEEIDSRAEATSALLRSLRRRGYVKRLEKRNDEDNRYSPYGLTEAGKEVLKQILNHDGAH